MASCSSTPLAAEDLQSVMHRLSRQIQHHAGPMYDRHRHSVLSMKECHFTSPHSPSHTSLYLCFHPSRGRPILVCFGPACLQLPLIAASYAQEGCGRTTGVCVLFRPPPPSTPTTWCNGQPLLCLAKDPSPPSDGPCDPPFPSDGPEPLVPPLRSRGGWGRVRSLSPMEVDEVERVGKDGSGRLDTTRSMDRPNCAIETKRTHTA